MAGKKFGIVYAARMPGSYHALPETEQAKAGLVFEQLSKKYQGKVELVRRYWTSAFTADATDVFVVECDDLTDAHAWYQEMIKMLSEGGDLEDLAAIPFRR